MRVLLIPLLIALAAPFAAADGCIVAPDIYELYEDAQLAFLRHADGVEDLHILPKFRGQAAEFAWIVPTPAPPAVELSDIQLFHDLADLSRPEYRHRDDGWGCEDNDVIYADAGGGVEVISDEVLGQYQVLVLAADDAAALADSLSAWGYLHAANEEALQPLLDDYVDRGWSFTAVRFDPEQIAEVDPEFHWWGGLLEPLRLTFASEEPVYPLKISSVSAYHTSAVTLYAAADRRLDFPDAVTVYANRFTDGELNALRGRHPAAAGHLGAGDFLTKLQRIYSPEQMDQDLVLVEAETQDEFLRIYYSGLPVTSGLLLALAGWMLHRRRRA